MSETIDLRSDTVTRPRPRCARRSPRAPVGDDQYGETPRPIASRSAVASLLGKAASLSCRAARWRTRWRCAS